MGFLYAGTSIVSGIGQACVTATGARTQFGAIAQSLVQQAPPTEYERGARSFGLIIMRTVVGLVVFVFLVSALLHHDLLESLLFALALAVGLTPEFLPMIMTVTLGGGAQRMAQGKVIVRRLAAIENLGTMHVLCSDKPAPCTRGTLTLQSANDGLGKPSQDVLRSACVNSALESASAARSTRRFSPTITRQSAPTRNGPNCPSTSSGGGSACSSAAQRVCRS